MLSQTLIYNNTLTIVDIQSSVMPFSCASWNVQRLTYAQLCHCFDYMVEYDVDMLFLNETKCTADTFHEWLNKYNDEHECHWIGMVNPCNMYHHHGTGVLIHSRHHKEINDESMTAVHLIANEEWEEKDKRGHLMEGRIIRVCLYDRLFVGTYVPNSGRKLDRLDYRVNRWDTSLHGYLHQLSTRLNKPVYWIGDLNVVPTDFDIHNPKKGKDVRAGCTKLEKDSHNTFLKEKGWIDVWRKFHPITLGSKSSSESKEEEVKEDEKEKRNIGKSMKIDVCDKGIYSWWSSYSLSNRILNKGWRLDHVVCNRLGLEHVEDCCIDDEVQHSDHAPIRVILS